MKLDDIKKQVEKYFDKVSPEEIIELFEGIGCKFEDIDKKGFVNWWKTELNTAKSKKQKSKEVKTIHKA